MAREKRLCIQLPARYKRALEKLVDRETAALQCKSTIVREICVSVEKRLAEFGIPVPKS